MKMRWSPSIALIVLVFVVLGCQNPTDVSIKSGSTESVVSDVVDEVVVEDSSDSVVEDTVVEDTVVEDTVVEDTVVEVENEADEVVVNATEDKPTGETYIVNIEALRLKPSKLTIKVGDTIIWKNNDQFKIGGVFHLLISYNKEFRSERFFRGEQFSHTFEKPGTFVYTDLIFTDRESMRGEIIVEE